MDLERFSRTLIGQLFVSNFDSLCLDRLLSEAQTHCYSHCVKWAWLPHRGLRCWWLVTPHRGLCCWWLDTEWSRWKAWSLTRFSFPSCARPVWESFSYLHLKSEQHKIWKQRKNKLLRNNFCFLSFLCELVRALFLFFKFKIIQGLSAFQRKYLHHP